MSTISRFDSHVENSAIENSPEENYNANPINEADIPPPLSPSSSESDIDSEVTAFLGDSSPELVLASIDSNHSENSAGRPAGEDSSASSLNPGTTSNPSPRPFNRLGLSSDPNARRALMHRQADEGSSFIPASRYGATSEGNSATHSSQNTLSRGKRSFMAEAAHADDLSTLARWLTSDEVEAVCRIYEETHKISIRANGKGGGLADTRIGLSSVLTDLVALAKSAQEQKKSIGYVVTGSFNLGWNVPVFEGGEKVHTEALIATESGDVLNITPSSFAPWMSHVLEIENRSCDYFASALDLLTDEIIEPQADGSQCGALSLSFLKEYLKNDATGLNCALLIKNDKEQSGIGFLLPPPHVLRYSQSSRYVEVLKTMVFSDEKTVVHQHKGKETNVPTLRGLLESGSAHMTTVNKKPFTEGDLDLYRLAWQEVLNDIVTPKREPMNFIREDGTAQNLYLSHVSQRLKNKLAKHI